MVVSCYGVKFIGSFNGYDVSFMSCNTFDTEYEASSYAERSISSWDEDKRILVNWTFRVLKG